MKALTREEFSASVIVRGANDVALRRGWPVLSEAEIDSLYARYLETLPPDHAPSHPA